MSRAVALSGVTNLNDSLNDNEERPKPPRRPRSISFIRSDALGKSIVQERPRDDNTNASLLDFSSCSFGKHVIQNTGSLPSFS
jgi:hypothetical protein